MIIIHNNGNIIATMSGNYTNPKIIVAQVPENKEVDYVDVETGEVVLKDKAKTEAERIADLEAQIAALAGSEV